MLGTIKQLKSNITLQVYQHFFYLVQVICLSGAIIILFDALWSATLFLPLSVGIEILAKFAITHIINRFSHRYTH